MTHLITQNCCNDAACVTVCPVNCIHPTPDEPGYATADMLYIDPTACIDCGACVEVCPVGAIAADYELPEGAERYPEINEHYYRDPAHTGHSPSPRRHRGPAVEVTEKGPLRVAIVGSGPAGCYAAGELLDRKGIDARVTLIERLPVPWGLVRFGVAPDHQATKRVTSTFESTIRRDRLNLLLNVELGTHLSHEELAAHHQAVIYAVGAPGARTLAVPGEDLPGSHPATDLVAWYNGHPRAAEYRFDLSGERAVVVGNGNVALDVARILALNPGTLARTDIADHALAALADSAIREVVVLGRRGPAQAAFSTPQLLGLADEPGIDLVVDPAEVEIDPLTERSLAPHDMAALKVGVLREVSQRQPRDGRRRVVLRFLAAPIEIQGGARVTGLRTARTELVESGGRLVAVPTGETENIRCGLVVRAAGYRGNPVPGLPFDDARGVLPQQAGRVLSTVGGRPLPGVYAAGWVKRGPSGVIGTNRHCAQETVGSLLDDYTEGRLTAPAHEPGSLWELVAERQPALLDRRAWGVLDQHERDTGRRSARPRLKVTSVQEMMRVVEDATSCCLDQPAGTRPERSCGERSRDCDRLGCAR